MEHYEAKEKVSTKENLSFFLLSDILPCVSCPWQVLSWQNALCPMQQFEDILKHKQLELQLCEAKLAQQTVAMAETKESNLAEKEYVCQ